MVFCGPKLSLFGVVLSIWAIVQLFILGFLCFFESVALFEDLPVPGRDKKLSQDEFYDKVETGYRQTAYNCWLATGLYVILLIVSFTQCRANRRLEAKKKVAFNQ